MSVTAPSECGGRSHSLWVASTAREQRVGVAAWVDRQLAGGAKVYYKGWAGSWLLSPGGPSQASRAIASGQLEVATFADVAERCGGTAAGLRELQAGEVAQALEEGWARVAMSQERPGLPVERRADEAAAQEAGLDELARRWPLTTLCQLTLADEDRASAWEAAAVHHRGLYDGQWSSWSADGRWWVRGDLDAHVVARFGAALHGALREQRHADGDSDLHVDVSGVEFVDLACVRSLLGTARAAGSGQRTVLHGAPPFLRALVEAVGRPRTVLFADDGSGG